MIIKEIKCKNCMTKSKLTDYVINPYTGCQHGCKYCYADFIRRFQNIKEKWGDFVHIKTNCPELLEKELKKNKPGHIWLSSVCDCYMPIEGKTRLTRKILETIANSDYKNKFTIEILTKSALIRRDFELIKKLNAEIGFSINTLDIENSGNYSTNSPEFSKGQFEKKDDAINRIVHNKVTKVIEPFASPPLERIKILKEAKEFGIRVFGFISPVLPGITNLEELFKELKFCDYVWVELLNTKKSILNKFIPVIKSNFPEKIKDFEFAIKNSEEYYKLMEREVMDLEKKYKLRVEGFVAHNL